MVQKFLHACCKQAPVAQQTPILQVTAKGLRNARKATTQTHAPVFGHRRAAHSFPRHRCHSHPEPQKKGTRTILIKHDAPKRRQTGVVRDRTRAKQRYSSRRAGDCKYGQKEVLSRTGHERSEGTQLGKQGTAEKKKRGPVRDRTSKSKRHSSRIPRDSKYGQKEVLSETRQAKAKGTRLGLQWTAKADKRRYCTHGERAYEVVGEGRLGRLLDLGVGGSRLSPGDVLSDGACEEHRLLKKKKKKKKEGGKTRTTFLRR